MVSVLVLPVSAPTLAGIFLCAVSFLDNRFDRILHALPDSSWFSCTVQNHGDVRFCYSEFSGKFLIRNIVVVHLTNETACPFFRQLNPSYPLKLLDYKKNNSCKS